MLIQMKIKMNPFKIPKQVEIMRKDPTVQKVVQELVKYENPVYRLIQGATHLLKNINTNPEDLEIKLDLALEFLTDAANEINASKNSHFTEFYTMLWGTYQLARLTFSNNYVKSARMGEINLTNYDSYTNIWKKIHTTGRILQEALSKKYYLILEN